MKTNAPIRHPAQCPAHRMRRAAALLSSAAILFASTAATAAEALKAELSNSENACFRRGEPVRMTLFAEGFAPGVEATGDIVVLDAWDRDIERHALRFTPDETGAWRGEFLLPSDRYGFRRVRVSTTSGATLPKRGSAPAGTLSYAVLHGPEERRPIGEKDAFFGLYGDACGISRWLGMHHIYAGGMPKPEGRRPPADGWSVYGTIVSGEPRFLNGFATEEERASLNAAKGRRAPIAACLTEEGRRHYASALSRLAAAAVGQYGERRFHEPLLEPELFATPEEIVAAAEVAYNAIHAGDPDAIVAFPDVCNVMDVSSHKKLFALGIGRFMDAFALHPYCPYPPEPSGFLRNVRLLAQMADEAVGRKLTKIATEAGFAAPVGKERAQMNGLVRKQLILLGEGWDFSYAFYPHDYANDLGDWHDGDYGVFYNLDLDTAPGKARAETRWGISHVAPRPAAAALSAASWYLDGYRPVACFDDIGGTALGYAYALVTPPSRDEGKERGGRRNAEAERNASRDVGSRAEPQNGKVSRPSPTTDAEPGTLPLRSAETPRFNNSAGEPPTPSVVLALWDYGTGCEVEISVGREDITVADIMGEERVEECPGGVLRLTLGESPQYILDPVLPERGRPVRRMSKGDDSATTASGQQQERPAFATARRFDTDHVWPLDAATSPDAVAAPGVEGVRLAFGWNERYFAVDAIIDDDVFLQRFTGWDTWKDDSLQIALAGSVLRVGTANFLHDLRTEAYTENTVALTPDGPAIHRTVTWDDEALPAGHGADAAIAFADAPRSVEVLAGKNIRYRAAFPWRFLGRETPPAPGDSVWFAACVNDRDTPDGPLSQRHVFDFKDAAPKGFGRILLAP